MTRGNFQDVHPDGLTASTTPDHPSLRMALSVASHMGWPIECWDVSTAFAYAHLFGDRDTDFEGVKGSVDVSKNPLPQLPCCPTILGGRRVICC